MQEKNLNIIPSGDMPVIYASQYDKNRVIRFNLFEGDDEYTLTGTETVKCNIRKNDEHIVIINPTIGNNTYIDVVLTEQACACFGDNIGEITISSDADTLIGTINFILKVERNPIQGGVTSASDIADLETQIEDIIHEVMSDDYYTRDEVDAKLDLKANSADIYTKSEVDTALGLKADKADTYTKTQVDTALALKADSSSVYTKSEVDTALASKANAADVYTKTEVDEIIEELYPVNSASGSLATFTTSLALPLVAMSAEIVAKQASGTPTPSNPLPITGVSSVGFYQRGINIWDEDWDNGAISNSTGQNTTGTNVRSKNYIPVAPNTSYYLIAPNTVSIFSYGVDKTYLGKLNISSTGVFSVPSDVYFLRFIITTAYGQTYNNDISINYPSTDTQYHAYNGETKTIALGQTVYGGVLDCIGGTGTITHAIVDLSTINWVYASDAKRWRGVKSDMKNYQSRSNDIIFEKYETDAGATIGSENKGYISGAYIYIHSTDDTTSPSGNACYPLATPVEITGLTPANFTTIAGENNIFADCGDISVSFKQGIQEYIDSKVGA